LIQIEDKLDDEEKLEFVSDEQLYLFLGLKGEDDQEKQDKERRTCGVGTCNGDVRDDSLATIPIFQHLREGRVMFDINNSVIETDSLYPNMK
jgi:hypothetical protein